MAEAREVMDQLTKVGLEARDLELATVEDGLITQYEFYFDQLDLMQKLGLVPETL